MRKCCLILLLLAGCGSDSDESSAADRLSEEEMLQGLTTSAAPDPVRLRQLIDRGMAVVLPNPKDALYRNVRGGVGGAACGEVAPQGRAADFRPFVVTSDGVTVIGTSPTIAFNDPEDLLADAWIRWCAAPEELQRLASGLSVAPADAGGLEAPPAELPAFEALPPAPVAPAPPAPEPKQSAAPAAGAPSPAQAPPPEIGSFFNSVQRPSE